MALIGQSKQATAAKTSLIYLTIGALTIVWTAIWYWYLKNNGAAQNTYLWVYGFMATGVVLLIIGAAVGQIGRSAMPAETASTAEVVPGAAGAVASSAPSASPPAGTGQQTMTRGTIPASPVAPAQARRM
jgi:hypothetical protein